MKPRVMIALVVCSLSVAACDLPMEVRNAPCAVPGAAAQDGQFVLVCESSGVWEAGMTVEAADALKVQLINGYCGRNPPRSKRVRCRDLRARYGVPVPSAAPAQPIAAPSPQPALSPAPTPAPSCHPSYVGACLPPDRDVDCKDVPNPVTVVGPDVYRLDRDNDGVGCEAN